jgi:hypothetical protein
MIILFTIMFMIFIIFHNIFLKKKEYFSINDIDNMFDDVNKITRVVNNVPEQINKINDKLGQQVNKMGQQIEQKTEKMVKQIEEKTKDMGEKIQENTINILTNKLKNIFIEIGNVLNTGIIKPILAVFTGIGNIFIQIFNILKEIGNKIVSLPNCIFTYAIKSTIDTLNALYDRIFPKFLKNIFSSIYYYTFKYVFDFIGYITGYDDNVKRCYGFNVSSELGKINSNFDKIKSSFEKDFGRLDFSKIQI